MKFALCPPLSTPLIKSTGDVELPRFSVLVQLSLSYSVSPYSIQNFFFIAEAAMDILGKVGIGVVSAPAIAFEKLTAILPTGGIDTQSVTAPSSLITR